MEPIVGKKYRTSNNVLPIYCNQEFTVLEIDPKESFLIDHIKIMFTDPQIRSKDGWNSIVKGEWHLSVIHPIEPKREIYKLSFV